MKEYNNIYLNINKGVATCIVVAIFTGAGLLVYYAEKGFLPSYIDGRFEFTPVDNKKKILELVAS